MKADDELKADVEAELSWDPSFDNRGIVVEVTNGVVTVAGSVAAYAHKWAAESAIKNVAGVRAIANEIEVKPETIYARSDKDIAEAAASALKSNVSVPASQIKAIVSGGWVTLEGKAAFWHQKKAAEDAVRGLWGVKGITNDIALVPQVDAGAISGKIHRTFERRANLDADKVHVAVAEGTVTLTGEVSSLREREDAETAAWAAPGIRHVDNRLTVSA